MGFPSFVGHVVTRNLAPPKRTPSDHRGSVGRRPCEGCDRWSAPRRRTVGGSPAFLSDPPCRGAAAVKRRDVELRLAFAWLAFPQQQRAGGRGYYCRGVACLGRSYRCCLHLPSSRQPGELLPVPGQGDCLPHAASARRGTQQHGIPPDGQKESAEEQEHPHRGRALCGCVHGQGRREDW